MSSSDGGRPLDAEPPEPAEPPATAPEGRPEPDGVVLPEPATDPVGPPDGFTWNPDGEELAKALLARAKAAGRQGRRAPSRKSSGTGTGRWRRRAPGAGWSGPGVDDRDPQALAAAVDKLVGEHGWGEDLAVHGAVARWDQVVGAEVAAHVQPEHYADGVLSVRADSTAWATQVRLFAAELVRRLNAEIGDGSVTRVDVRGPQGPSWRRGPRSVPGRGPRDTYG